MIFCNDANCNFLYYNIHNRLRRCLQLRLRQGDLRGRRRSLGIAARLLGCQGALRTQIQRSSDIERRRHARGGLRLGSTAAGRHDRRLERVSFPSRFRIDQMLIRICKVIEGRWRFQTPLPDSQLHHHISVRIFVYSVTLRRMLTIYNSPYSIHHHIRLWRPPIPDNENSVTLLPSGPTRRSTDNLSFLVYDQYIFLPRQSSSFMC